MSNVIFWLFGIVESYIKINYERFGSYLKFLCVINWKFIKFEK